MILSGLCLEVVGPRYNLLIGGILASIGYLFLWAIATLIIRHVPDMAQSQEKA